MLLGSSQRSSNLAQLTSQLNTVNNEFHSTINNELDRLREQERVLQTALKLKTRNDLINTMQRELAVDDFHQDLTGHNTALMLTSSTNKNLNSSFGNNSSINLENSFGLSVSTNNNFVSSAIADFQALNLNNLNKSIDLSDDGLRKSHIILDKLIREYSANSTEAANSSVNELLRSAAFDPSYKNRHALNTQEIVRPSVIYATKRPNQSANYRTKVLAINRQDLNRQQTLREDLRFKTTHELNRSLARMSAVLSEREMAKSIRDNYFYSSKDRSFNGIPRSKLRPSGSGDELNRSATNAVRLPLSKTLVHDKPWSPGKVDGAIYYNQKVRVHKK